MIMKINNHFKDQTKFLRYGTFLNVPDSDIQSPSENNSFNDNQRAVVLHPTPSPKKSNNFFMFFTFLQRSMEQEPKLGGWYKRCKIKKKSLVVQVQVYKKGASLSKKVTEKVVWCRCKVTKKVQI